MFLDENANISVAEARKQLKKRQCKVEEYRLKILMWPDNEVRKQLQENEIQICKNDFWHWLTHWAVTKDERADTEAERYRVFDPLRYLKFLADFITEKKDGRFVHQRILFPKSRQMIISWFLLAYLVWDISFNRGENCMIQSYNEMASVLLMQRAQGIYERLPEFMKVKNSKSSMLALTLNELDSTILGVPEGAKHVRGRTLNLLLQDEAAYNEVLSDCLEASEPSIGNTGQLLVPSSADICYFWDMVNDQNDIAKDPGRYRNRSNIQQPLRGITTWHNDGNDFDVVKIHYTADPFKDPERWGLEWWEKNKKKLPQQKWEKEMEINPVSKAGELIYPEFNPEIHIVEPYNINYKSDCTRYMGIDYGIASPTGVLWIAVFEKPRRIVVYREHYQAGKEINWHCDRIREKEGWFPREDSEYDYPWNHIQGRKWNNKVEKIRMRIIDPSVKKQGVGRYTVWSEYNGPRNAMGTILGNNSWEVGRERVSMLFMERNPDGSPVFQVFSSCVNFIKEITEYREEPLSNLQEQRRDRPAGGKPMKKADHLMDVLRYLVLCPTNLSYDPESTGACEFEISENEDDDIWEYDINVDKYGRTTGYC